MQTPSHQFQHLLDSSEQQTHPAQLSALQHFDALQSYLLDNKQKNNVLLKLKSLFNRQKTPHIYCWGDVGQGKTMMMDAFCQSLPPQMVLRQHFHAFMLDIHKRLKSIQHSDPMETVALALKQHYAVICLDELIVDNIVDAMLLSKLLPALDKMGVPIVTSTNTPPDLLLERNAHRKLFLPTVAFIKSHFDIIHLETGQDYRQQYTTQDLYHQGSAASGQQFLTEHWQKICNQPIAPETLTIYQRPIAVKAHAPQAIWLSFSSLCSPPRAAKDYLFLCQHYQWIFIDEVGPLRQDANNKLYNWVKFVDICYDNQTQIIIASSSNLRDIYADCDHLIKYERCLSRLEELLSGKMVHNKLK